MQGILYLLAAVAAVSATDLLSSSSYRGSRSGSDAYTYQQRSPRTSYGYDYNSAPVYRNTYYPPTVHPVFVRPIIVYDGDSYRRRRRREHRGSRRFSQDRPRRYYRRRSYDSYRPSSDYRRRSYDSYRPSSYNSFHG